MYYTVYKITNNFDDKCYIGVHQTINTEDGYMGSGVYLNRAYEKHGIENFSKEILFTFNNQDDMFSKEAELVNEEFVSWANTYNIKIGGEGGWDYVNKTGVNVYPNHADIARLNIQIATKVHKERLASNTEYKEMVAETSRSNLQKYRDNNPSPWIGRQHTPETKEKMKASRKGRFGGAANSRARTVIDDKGNEFPTVLECASFYGVGDGTIRRWCNSGKFKYNHD